MTESMSVELFLVNNGLYLQMTSATASGEYYNIKTAADISNMNPRNNKPADNNPYYNIFEAKDRKASYVNMRSLQNSGGSEYYNV